MRLITLPDYDVRLWPSKVSTIARLPNDLNSIKIYEGRVYGILAAPVCTVFSNAASRIPRTDEELLNALSMVDAVLRLVHVLKPTFWALENPVGKLYHWLGSPQLIFNPCDYGDPYTKRTCLWGNFNAPLKRPVQSILYSNIAYLAGGKSDKTKQLRSITPPGFTQAFYEANR